MTETTKDRILDTAERLFAEQGFDATSLRLITAEADVNLASVNYHFQTKEALLDAILLRKIRLVNQQRDALLDRFEAEAGGNPAPVDKVLEAFIAPAFAMAARHPQFARLMGRLQTEQVMPRLMSRYFQPLVDRFVGALKRAVPEVEAAEVMWRIHFMIGAVAHSLRCAPQLAGTPVPPLAPEAVAEHLVAFLAAGFRAAVPAVREH